MTIQYPFSTLAKLTFCVLSLLLSVTSTQVNAAQPPLNGVAVYSDLGKEVFIGALYSAPLSDNVEVLVNNSQSLRMELRILSPDGISARRFSRFWVDSVGINNSQALLTDQADNMVKFDSFFKGRLITNDIVAITLETGKGVNIYVNEILVGNISSDKFFGMLLKAWVGKAPPSSSFKEGVLKMGNVPAPLKARFDSIKPTKERIAEMATWGKPKTPQELAAEAAKVAATTTTVAASSIAATGEPQQPITPKAAVKTAEAKAAEARAAEAARIAAAKQQAEEDAQPVLTAKSILARQFYTQECVNKIRSVVRYPAKSLEKNQTGSVRYAVVVDHNGNITSTTLLEGSEFKLLNDAALKAITQSAPYKQIPEDVKATSIEFTVPIVFKLAEK